MNQVQRHSRAASDFSIARILADDHIQKSRVSSLSATVKIYGKDSKNVSQQERDVAAIDETKSLSHSRFVGEISPFTSCHTTSSESNKLDGQNTFDDSRLHSSRTIVSQDESSQFARGSGRDFKNLKIERNELSWLQCTRYRPPKLLRKTVAGKSGKRRPGAHPRIPFTTSQLQVLEDKYRTSAYLSRRDVIHLSTILRLPQSRVKIWFQNRRARDRRETGISGSNVTILSGDAPSAYKSQDILSRITTASNTV